MKKVVIKNEYLNEQYISIDHSSGLKLLLYPMENYSSAYVIFGTKYGSVDKGFKLKQDEEYQILPDGIAHFLEHKLFENEDGDAFSLFAKTGASANAYTSFDKTCYLFSCTDNFEQSLRILLDFVKRPYFTEQSIQKEQGIIAQEIEMYNDSPGWRVFFNLLQILYKSNPVRTDIAGSRESISNIDKEVLYKCYNTFYNLNNMVLSISGKFDVDKVLEIVDEVVNPEESLDIYRKEFEEDSGVLKDEIFQKLEVGVPLFNIGYKAPVFSGFKLLEAEIETKILVDIMFGESSALYKRLYDSGLINSTFGSEILSGQGYFCIIFSGESKDPKEVFKQIKSEIDHFKKNKISQQVFERCKKSTYGQYIRMFNNVEALANSMVSSHFNGVGLYDVIEILKKVKLDNVISRLDVVFDDSKSAISIVASNQL